MDIISKQDAVSRGLIYYFTGKPCKRGHVSKRYVGNSACAYCKNEHNKIRNQQYDIKMRLREYQVKYDTSEKGKELRRKRQQSADAKKRASDKIKAKRKNDNVYRITRNIGSHVYQCLRRNKGGKSWQSLVSFTLEQLIDHLERQFRDGMTWDNYGPYWHLDHIKPIAACESFEEAWRLDNLQPLLAKENLHKNSIYQGQRFYKNIRGYVVNESRREE